MHTHLMYEFLAYSELVMKFSYRKLDEFFLNFDEQLVTFHYTASLQLQGYLKNAFQV